MQTRMAEQKLDRGSDLGVVSKGMTEDSDDHKLTERPFKARAGRTGDTKSIGGDKRFATMLSVLAGVKPDPLGNPLLTPERRAEYLEQEISRSNRQGASFSAHNALIDKHLNVLDRETRREVVRCLLNRLQNQKK